MPSETVQYCSKCERPFREGQTRYLVTISVVADFDGTLGKSSSPGELDRLWSEIDEKSEDELMDEVARKVSYVLCKPCRDEWMASPLGVGESRPEDGNVH